MVEYEGEDSEDKFVKQFVGLLQCKSMRFWVFLLFDRGFSQFGGEGYPVYWM